MPPLSQCVETTKTMLNSAHASPPMILRAKYLMPHSELLIENGAIVIDGSQIVDVGKYQTIRKGNSLPVRDMGESLIMPGFVNAHTHLELTNHSELIHNTNQFKNWILELIGSKTLTQEQVDSAIARGIEMSLEAGTTSIGDIQSIGVPSHRHKDSPIRAVLFFETTGFSAQRTQIGLSRIDEHLASAPPRDPLFTPGISPHAPYSTSEALYRHCVQLARERQLSLCTHLAETAEEREFLMSGTGIFVELLNSLGISLECWTPPKCSPVEYLRDLGVLAVNPIIAHCNYLTENDVLILRGNAVSVVFCPRTHHLFDHTAHPVPNLLTSGVNVAIGTDSLASNWSLSMHDELKFLANTHKTISPESMFNLVTLNGAKALSLTRTGVLRPGWQADLIALSIPNDARKVPEQIIDSASGNILTVVSGRVCYVRT